MVFLNPLVLWACLAIAVPIIVHLFNFRKPKQVLFSNLAFVRSVNKTVVQRLKLKQWLLLAARILAILALVFCFANPVIPESGGVVLNQDRSVVIIVDNSESMSTADPKGTLLQQARLLGEEILKAHPETDEFQVQTTAGLQYNTNFTTRELAIEALSEVDYASNNLSLSDLIKSADLLFTEAQNSGRQVYLLSDFQQSTVLADSLPSKLDMADNINLFLLPVGAQPSANLYVSDIRSKNPVLEAGEPVTLQLRLNNIGDSGLDDVGLRVSVDGREVSIGTVESIGVNSSVQTEIRFTPQKGGWLSGKITLDDPEAEFDNVRYFSLYIPENQKLLIVEGSENQQYVRLFYQKLLKSYRTTFVSEAELGNSQLGDYEAVVLSGISSISSGARERLAQYVTEGGGLIMFPGKSSEKADLNALYARLEAGQWRDQQAFDQPLSYEEAAFDHPLFKGMFEQFDSRAGFDSPAIQRLWQFEPSGKNIQQVLLRASNGLPVLHESRYKDGRLFTFTLHPSLNWSDWPLKPSYAPLLFRTTLLATQHEQQQLSRSIADDTPYRLPAGDDERLTLKQLNVEEPQELVPALVKRGGSRLLQFDQTALEPGNYGLYAKDSLLAQIAFNAPEAESQLGYPTRDALEALISPIAEGQVKVMNASPDVIRSEVQQASFGFQLWQYFLLFALAMLLAEVLILKLLR